MNENLPPLEVPPPPPPPAKPKARLIIWIVAGVVVLCLCLVAIGVGIYIERDNIPAISGLFASATPEGVYYNSTGMNISLYYPPTWVHNEDFGVAVFASSQEVIDGADFPVSGAGLILMRDPDILSSLAAGVDTSSPEAILNVMLDPQNAFLSTLGAEIEPVRSITLRGHPAASAVYTLTGSPSSPELAAYLVVIVPDGTPLLIIAMCPRDEWTTHRATFDGMIASLEIRPMP